MCKVTWCNNETEFYNKTQRLEGDYVAKIYR